MPILGPNVSILNDNEKASHMGLKSSHIQLSRDGTIKRPYIAKNRITRECTHVWHRKALKMQNSTLQDVSSPLYNKKVHLCIEIYGN